MKVTNVNDPGERAHGIVRGHTGKQRAGSAGLTFRDGITTAIDAWNITIVGGIITRNPDGSIVITIGDEPGVPGSGGGASVPVEHGNMGPTETVSLVDGNVHHGTLNADCTITVEGFDVGLFREPLFLEVAQNGTGGFGITWDPDVAFYGDDQPDQAATAVTHYVFFGMDGDGLIYAFKAGGGGSSVGALDDLSDVTITTPAEDDQLQYVGGTWVNHARRWEPVTFDPGTGPEIVFTATDIVMTWETY